MSASLSTSSVSQSVKQSVKQPVIKQLISQTSSVMLSNQSVMPSNQHTVSQSLTQPYSQTVKQVIRNQRITISQPVNHSQPNQPASDSLFDLLEVTHLCGCHWRPVKPYARQAGLLRAVVVFNENLFSRYVDCHAPPTHEFHEHVHAHPLARRRTNR